MSEIQRKHERFMQEALLEARRAGEAGDVPVGCVVVRGDEIIGRAGNEIQRTADPTRHAETIAIAEASAHAGTRFLDDCTLYVTLEPCCMCAGAILLARIPTVVFAATDEKTGAVRSMFEMLDDQRLPHRCVVRSGIMAGEASAILKEFFAERREREEPAASREASATTQNKTPAGSLLLVPTPIGNIEDITVRGLKALKSADIILCEDTRHTGQLLRRYGVDPKRLVSNHEHNERERAQAVVEWIRQGKSVVLVSDAGTPGISDPGMRAVQACVQAGVRVTALPGASALTTAASASGLATDALYFVGFPPQRKGRATWLVRTLQQRGTIVMYEAPHRLQPLLQEIEQECGADRQVVVARELTKVHEEYLRGSVREVRTTIEQRGGVKGECVVLVSGVSGDDE